MAQQLKDRYPLFDWTVEPSSQNGSHTYLVTSGLNIQGIDFHAQMNVYEEMVESSAIDWVDYIAHQLAHRYASMMLEFNKE